MKISIVTKKNVCFIELQEGLPQCEGGLVTKFWFLCINYSLVEFFFKCLHLECCLLTDAFKILWHDVLIEKFIKRLDHV